jgi:hypothetical protein
MALAFEAMTSFRRRSPNARSVFSTRRTNASATRSANRRELAHEPDPVFVRRDQRLIANARVAIAHAIYFLQPLPGTRFLTLKPSPGSTHCRTTPSGASAGNRQTRQSAQRFGHPEVESSLRDAPSPGRLRGPRCGRPETCRAQDRLSETPRNFRQAVPESFRTRARNIEWPTSCVRRSSRSPMPSCPKRHPRISPEFYMQIEWLPARVSRRRTHFRFGLRRPDAYADDPELETLCDLRAKASFSTTCANSATSSSSYRPHQPFALIRQQEAHGRTNCTSPGEGNRQAGSEDQHHPLPKWSSSSTSTKAKT